MIEDFEKRINAALDTINARLTVQSPPSSPELDPEIIDALKRDLQDAQTQNAALRSELDALQSQRAQETSELKALYQKLADVLNTPSNQEEI